MTKKRIPQLAIEAMNRGRAARTSLRLAILAVSIPILGMTPTVAAEDVIQAAPILDIAQSELDRSLARLKEQPEPVYFMSYEITEAHEVDVASAFGSLVQSSDRRERLVDIDLRVGGYDLDSSHEIRGGFDPMAYFDRFTRTQLPLADDESAIRAKIWYATDKKYKRAVEKLTKIRTNVQVKVEQEDKSADFSREEPAVFVEPLVRLDIDRDAWEAKIRRYTAPFARHGNIYEAQARLDATAETRWLVSSEGTRIQTSGTLYRLFISAFTKADDGMELPRYESFTAIEPDGLPSDENVLAVVDGMIADLLALREAPVVDPYTGPAILHGRASGVFFHEVFGHRVEGHRQKSEREGQTFKKKIGQKILPATFSVYFDPTLKSAAGTDLAGFYRYDNEGVKARRVTVIDKGVFKSFLMSRTPIDGFPKSNGHGRKEAGFAPVSRQSNLVVDVKDTVTREQLKKELLKRVKAEDKPFGLIFEDIQGGFTTTGRGSPNAFNVLPIMVYRVFEDGREELVRGVDLIGTPLQAFNNVLMADDTIEVFNGVCGAESGGVPVSASSPSILVSQIEVQKKQKSQERPPILPAPQDIPAAEAAAAR
ncbi:MAG: metallopeptidase TldD-related protein [Acidobacteriota bacterium]|nr:metallopeptidase TldD-related protein [Acidobacteriota bacterium]